MYGKEYVVYLDVFFMINFFMDLILIYATGKVLKIIKSKIRIILSASAGALYAVIIIIQPLNNHFLFMTLSNILAAMLMVRIAYTYVNFISYIKSTVTLLVITFIMSGIMNYLYYSTSLGTWIRINVMGSGSESVQFRRFLLITFSSYILLSLIRKIYSVFKEKHLLYCNVQITYLGKTIEARALIDTGNNLKEPISGNDVHIAEYKILKPLLEGDESAKEKLCVIPYHSIGKNEGILYGIRMDDLKIINEKQEKTISKPIVAIYKGTLSQNNNYSIILNKNILEEFNI